MVATTCKWCNLASKIQISFQKFLIPFNQVILVSTDFFILPLHIQNITSLDLDVLQTHWSTCDICTLWEYTDDEEKYNKSLF